MIVAQKNQRAQKHQAHKEAINILETAKKDVLKTRAVD